MASDTKVKDLVTLKREIRALLISSKRGCTPEQLQNDYLQVMGENIPYHFLGHTNFMSFIYSIPDVASVNRSRNNPVLYGVADSTTKKIQDMVSKQRDSGSSWSSTSSAPRMNQITRTTQPAPKSPQVPPVFKARLREMMLSHPNGVALKFFNEAFSKRFHHYIAYRNWGFDSLEEMVNSVKDILFIHNDTTRNIKMVKRVPAQEKPGTKGSEGSKGAKKDAAINWYSLGHRRGYSMSAVRDDRKDREDVVNVGGRSQAVSPVKSRGGANAVAKDSLHSLELSPQMKKKFLDDIRSNPRSVSPGVKPVPRPLMGQIKALLQANKSGIWVSRFLMEFKEHFNVDLNVKEFGHTSVVHLLHSVPCCAVEKPGGAGDWLVYLKGTTPPKVAANHKFHSAAYVSEELIKAVHKTLQGSKQGIPLPMFTERFKLVTDFELPLVELGFSSSAELLQRVPGLEVVRPPNVDSVMVYSTWSGSELKPEKEEAEEERKLDKEVALIPSPDDKGVSQPSVYKLVSLPAPSHSKFHSVYVTEVRTPSSISIQLIGKETTQVLECLQEDMTTFYSSKGGKNYTIDEAFPGQACCAMFNNDNFWYRAEVKQLVCPDVVKIRYVDYGNESEVPLTSVRRPKLTYLTLPAQAVDCRLCHLKPAGSAWSLRANQLLKQMTRDLPLVAIITAKRNRFLSVYLVDTSTSRDVYINDALVSQGLALFETDTPADTLGFEEYSLQGPLPGGYGRSLPEVRMPKEPCASSGRHVPGSLPSQHLLSAIEEKTTPLYPTGSPPQQSKPQGDHGRPLQQNGTSGHSTFLQKAASFPPSQQATPLPPSHQATPLPPSHQATFLPSSCQATPFPPSCRATPLPPQQPTPLPPTGLYQQASTQHAFSGPQQNGRHGKATPFPPSIPPSSRGTLPPQSVYSSHPPLFPYLPHPPPGAQWPHQVQYYPPQWQPLVYPTMQPHPVSSWQHRLQQPTPPGHTSFVSRLAEDDTPLVPPGYTPQDCRPSHTPHIMGMAYAPGRTTGDVPLNHTQLTADHTQLTSDHTPDAAVPDTAPLFSQEGLECNGKNLPNETAAARDMLDDISTPSSSDDETTAAIVAMATCGSTLEQLLEKKQCILRKMSQGGSHEVMSALVQELTTVLKEVVTYEQRSKVTQQGKGVEGTASDVKPEVEERRRGVVATPGAREDVRGCGVDWGGPPCRGGVARTVYPAASYPSIHSYEWGAGGVGAGGVGAEFAGDPDSWPCLDSGEEDMGRLSAGGRSPAVTRGTETAGAVAGIPGIGTQTAAETPGIGTQTAGAGAETPGTGTETAAVGAETPRTGTETAAVGAETPGIGTQTAGAETPGTGTETAAVGAETPGIGTQTAGAGTETAAVGAETTGIGTQMAAVGAGTGTETAAVGAETPGIGTQMAAVGAETPGIGMKTAAAGTETAAAMPDSGVASTMVTGSAHPTTRDMTPSRITAAYPQVEGGKAKTASIESASERTGGEGTWGETTVEVTRMEDHDDPSGNAGQVETIERKGEAVKSGAQEDMKMSDGESCVEESKEIGGEGLWGSGVGVSEDVDQTGDGDVGLDEAEDAETSLETSGVGVSLGDPGTADSSFDITLDTTSITMVTTMDITVDTTVDTSGENKDEERLGNGESTSGRGTPGDISDGQLWKGSAHGQDSWEDCDGELEGFKVGGGSKEGQDEWGSKEGQDAEDPKEGQSVGWDQGNQCSVGNAEWDCQDWDGETLPLEEGVHPAASEDHATIVNSEETIPVSITDSENTADNTMGPTTNSENTSIPSTDIENAITTDSETFPFTDSEGTIPIPTTGSENTPSTDSEGTIPIPTTGSENTPSTDSEGTTTTGSEGTIPIPTTGSESTPSPDSEGTIPMGTIPIPTTGSEGTPSTDGEGTIPIPTTGSEGTPSTDGEGTIPIPTTGSEGTPSPDSEGTIPIPTTDSEGTIPIPTTDSEGTIPIPTTGSEGTPSTDSESTPSIDSEGTIPIPTTGSESTPSTDSEATIPIPTTGSESTPSTDSEGTIPIPTTNGETVPSTDTESTVPRPTTDAENTVSIPATTNTTPVPEDIVAALSKENMNRNSFNAPLNQELTSTPIATPTTPLATPNPYYGHTATPFPHTATPVHSAQGSPSHIPGRLFARSSARARGMKRRSIGIGRGLSGKQKAEVPGYGSAEKQQQDPSTPSMFLL